MHKYSVDEVTFLLEVVFTYLEVRIRKLDLKAIMNFDLHACDHACRLAGIRTGVFLGLIFY